MVAGSFPSMRYHCLPSPREAAARGTQGLRGYFLLDKLFQAGAVTLVEAGIDRVVVGSAMPAHTHLRRSEVYCYFDVPAAHRVLHLLGRPRETRPLWVADKEAVLSPAWSIHRGCGTAACRFVWAMGGENQDFADMDGVAIGALR